MLLAENMRGEISSIFVRVAKMVRYILTHDVLPAEVCPRNLMEHIHDEIVKLSLFGLL
jgi:hypothetical protein